jgi:tRNA-2-methylthio-N6-dimethylallyladenosine synthase
MRGCDKFCTFCIVPYVRGRERSLPIGEVVRQVEHAAAEGFKEVVFLGQTVNAYRDGDHDFASLLRRANDVPGIERIRFTSPHPSDFTDRAVAALAACDKVMPQIHLPLQSGSNRVLERMRRLYTIESYEALVARLRAAIPDLALSTDVIVGFPGETEEDFERTRDAMRRIGYDSAFLFKYSPRPGARSAGWEDDVPAEEKARRITILIEEQKEASLERNAPAVGAEVEVLVEGPSKRSPAHWFGKTRQFKTAVFAHGTESVGDLIRVRVAAVSPYTLFGEGVSSAVRAAEDPTP